MIKQLTAAVLAIASLSLAAGANAQQCTNHNPLPDCATSEFDNYSLQDLPGSNWTVSNGCGYPVKAVIEMDNDRFIRFRVRPDGTRRGGHKTAKVDAVKCCSQSGDDFYCSDPCNWNEDSKWCDD